MKLGNIIFLERDKAYGALFILSIIYQYSSEAIILSKKTIDISNGNFKKRKNNIINILDEQQKNFCTSNLFICTIMLSCIAS